METFETERIRARRLQPEDLKKFKAFHQDPDVMKGMGGKKSEVENQQWLLKNLDHWNKHGFGIWVLFDKEGKFIGRGGLRHTTVEEKDEIELAYAFLPSEWGKGLATELSMKLLILAKDLGFNEITSCAVPANTASIRVMEKVGFTYEKDFMYEDEGLCVLYRKKL